MKKKLCRIFILLGVVAFSQSAFSKPEDLLRIVRQNNTETLKLSEDLDAFLKQNFKNYRIPEAKDKPANSDWANFYKKDKLPPVYVTGDFNGDRRQDAAFLLMDANGKGLLVSLHGREDRSFDPFVLARLEESFTNLYIQLEKPQKVLTAQAKGYGTRDENTPDQINLKNDAISFGVFESGASIFYWDPKQQKYAEESTSD